MTTTAHDLEVQRFIKSARRISCSDVSDFARCNAHAKRMLANASFLSDALVMAISNVIEISEKHI